MIEIIKSKRRVRNYTVYDLEWIPGSLKVRLVGVYDERGYRCYYTVEDFLNGELTHKNRGRWFYAHAGGLADIQFVFRDIVRINAERGNPYEVDASTSGSSAIIVHVKRDKVKWTFVDSYWLLRDKLKNIGKAIGIEKGGATSFEVEDPDEPGINDAEFERRIAIRREWYATVNIYELIDYNEVDCKILYEAIGQFQEALLSMGGQLQMTLASCAMQLFRRKYLTKSIETYDEINEKARKSYFSSRVEVFEREVKNSYYYDINSSFPYAMTFPCPGEFAGITFSIPDNDKFLYIADCEIEVPDNYITPIPIRRKGRVFFPTGKWRSYLTSIDLALLEREGGKILKVHEVMLFHPFYDLSAYANDIYNKRLAAETDFEKIVYKLLLNSLYGKFAESTTKSKIFINPDQVPITWEEQMTMKMIQLFPGAWQKEVEIDIPHMHVPIATHITSFARQTLYDKMTLCGDFHYCDTDGFSTTEVLTTGKALGELKLEKIVHNGYFAAPKLYSLEGEELNKKNEWVKSNLYKGKGFSRLTAARFMKLIEGEAIEFERMARIKEVLRSGSAIPREGKYVKRIKIKSIFDEDFDVGKHSVPKRFTYPDGSTRPWDMKELEQFE